MRLPLALLALALAACSASIDTPTERACARLETLAETFENGTARREDLPAGLAEVPEEGISDDLRAAVVKMLTGIATDDSDLYLVGAIEAQQACDRA